MSLFSNYTRRLSSGLFKSQSSAPAEPAAEGVAADPVATVPDTTNPTERWKRYCEENPGAEECKIYDT